MAPYIVGIDLGTTHTVVAYAPSKAVGDDAIQLFEIEQLVALGEVATRPLLPSVRYHPAAGEIPEGDLVLPWGPSPDGAVIGSLARELGAQVPGRLVTSAKSWLSHAAVDRLAPILPWGASREVAGISPVAASASFLAHVRAAWNHRMPQAPLEAQELVLTVPASFDDVARALTLEAARGAGLPTLRLLEEPQAALYDWLFRHRAALSAELADTRLVLVCDVGGGTTDLSLVRVEMRGGEPRLERVAVGRHLMLGGDNMDLALAHCAEGKLAAAAGGQRLAPGALPSLIERCRAAKERLLAREAMESVAVTLLGTGSRLVGGARTVDLGRDEAERIVIDGFFPRVAADELPRRDRVVSGLVAFGLPYASDPAVTRHLAAFLGQHRGAAWPDAVLLNGGVFRAHAIATRLHETLAGWRGAVLKPLHNADPDIAVARGAVAYALARRGLAPKIAAGAARNYFLRVQGSSGDTPRGICVLPRGSEEGHEVPLEGRSFAMKSGEPVRFDLVATTSGTVAAGAQVDLSDLDAVPLPPLATVLRSSRGKGLQEIAVHLASTLTEVGTLALYCIADDDPSQRWRLEFQLRGDGAAASPQALPPRFAEAVTLVERVFGTRDRLADPKAVKQLRTRLDALFGQRDRWSLGLLRSMFDALLQRARGRRRSADHERVWLSLAGWCLRPGFGDVLDEWRIERLWPLYEQGVHHGRDAQVCAEWWTLWRRVAGGLDDAAQQRLLEDFAINLRGDEIDPVEFRRMQRPVPGGWDDMVRMCATLERIASEHKVEVGDWLVGQMQRGTVKAQSQWTLWSIGRLGARLPFHGSAHRVVPIEAAAAWLKVLLALDWKQVENAAAAAANLARMSGDRARDLPADLRHEVIDRLDALRAPPAWIARVREVVPLDEAGQQGVFGEALPLGLKLID
ncbi:Hsp70 family protein [Ramlibacter solisilvae]|uniref:Molecular chaperone DnaK n=1 Tax=Ramlibacter tataouinensis TaxID=94132 RepID=A0A127JWP5_9BURK|nr:Hsp70 family protein [Ramlibacter tataouinensis]AMO24417.1 molecular chaperone DnaK [Ramlibacter tataouinensis]